jgi:perosamine synthetase
VRIPQCEPSYPIDLPESLHRYVASGAWLTEGPKTREFEAAIASYTGAKHCIVTTSGTTALMLAGMAVGIKPGDEVIVPAYTMIATANAFRILGARVVFCDVEEETLCLPWDEAFMRAIGPRTTAVVMVDANGRASTNPERWRSALRPFDLPLIVDACQAMGSRYSDDLHCGRHGNIGCLSFSPHKIISTGQGGACITDDDDLAQRIRRAKDFGRDSGGGDVHPHFGINGKFTDLQAVVGLEQMPKLKVRAFRKRAMHDRYVRNLPAYIEHFACIDGHTPWFFDVLVSRRDELQAHLASIGIGTRKMYPPIPHQDCYRDGGSYPVAEDVGRRGLWLPSSVGITDDQIDEVCDAIRRFYDD